LSTTAGNELLLVAEQISLIPLFILPMSETFIFQREWKFLGQRSRQCQNSQTLACPFLFILHQDKLQLQLRVSKGFQDN
jgi:hypothetical protein